MIRRSEGIGKAPPAPVTTPIVIVELLVEAVGLGLHHDPDLLVAKRH